MEIMFNYREKQKGQIFYYNTISIITTGGTNNEWQSKRGRSKFELMNSQRKTNKCEIRQW